MKCKACGSEVLDSASFCTVCGVHLETGTRANGDAPDSAVYPLLTSANLLRMRGNWAAAEQKCIEVLRLYPNNATAHSLLGDVYAAQARWDDAIQWYQLAIDLDPDNQADRAKLDQARQRLSGEAQQAPEPDEAPGAGAGGWLGKGFSPLLQLTVIAILSFLVVLVAMSMHQKPGPEPLEPTGGFGVALPGSSPQPGASGAPSASLAPSDAAPTSQPGPGGTARPESPPAGARQGIPAVMPPTPDMSEWEARAFSRLQTDSWIAMHAAQFRVSGVVWEPVDQRLVATVVLLRDPGPAALRDDGVRYAYAVGQVLARIGFVSIEVIIKTPMRDGRGAVPVIAAQAEGVRAQMWVEDPAAAPLEALLTRFRDIWWHPDLRRDGAGSG